MKKYFMNRKQWGIETENMITRAVREHQEYWTKIMEQRIQQAKDKIFIEKQSEIRELQDEISELKNTISMIKREDHKKEKYKNELFAKTQSLDFHKKLIEEVLGTVGVRVGMADSAVISAEKLLKKDD